MGSRILTSKNLHVKLGIPANEASRFDTFHDLVTGRQILCVEYDGVVLIAIFPSDDEFATGELVHLFIELGHESAVQNFCLLYHEPSRLDYELLLNPSHPSINTLVS